MDINHSWCRRSTTLCFFYLFYMPLSNHSLIPVCTWTRRVPRVSVVLVFFAAPVQDVSRRYRSVHDVSGRQSGTHNGFLTLHTLTSLCTPYPYPFLIHITVSSWPCSCGANTLGPVSLQRSGEHRGYVGCTSGYTLFVCDASMCSTAPTWPHPKVNLLTWPHAKVHLRRFNIFFCERSWSFRCWGGQPMGYTTRGGNVGHPFLSLLMPWALL